MKKLKILSAIFIINSCFFSYSMDESWIDKIASYKRSLACARGVGSSFVALASLAVTYKAARQGCKNIYNAHNSLPVQSFSIAIPAFLAGTSAYVISQAMPYAYESFKSAFAKNALN